MAILPWILVGALATLVFVHFGRIGRAPKIDGKGKDQLEVEKLRADIQDSREGFIRTLLTTAVTAVVTVGVAYLGFSQEAEKINLSIADSQQQSLLAMIAEQRQRADQQRADVLQHLDANDLTERLGASG